MVFFVFIFYLFNIRINLRDYIGNVKDNNSTELDINYKDNEPIENDFMSIDKQIEGYTSSVLDMNNSSVVDEDVFSEQNVVNFNKWIWISSFDEYGNEFKPKKVGVFSIQFNNDDSFVTETDCNKIGGKYFLLNKNLTFNNVFSTKIFCENSDEEEFKKIFDKTDSFYYGRDGSVVLKFKDNLGYAIFK